MKDFYGKKLSVGDTVLVTCHTNTIYNAVGTIVKLDELHVKFTRFNPKKNKWEYKTIAVPNPKVIFKVNYQPESIDRFNLFFKECIDEF